MLIAYKNNKTNFKTHKKEISLVSTDTIWNYVLYSFTSIGKSLISSTILKLKGLTQKRFKIRYD